MCVLPTVDTALCAESFGESAVGQCQGQYGRKEGGLTRGPLLFCVLTSGKALRLLLVLGYA